MVNIVRYADVCTQNNRVGATIAKKNFQLINLLRMNFTTVLFDVHSSCCAHAHGSNATMSNGKCYGSIRKRNFHLNYSLKVTHKVRGVISSFEKMDMNFLSFEY